MDYFYCDSSAIINLFKSGDLYKLEQNKEHFHITDLQIKYELLFPTGIKETVLKCLTIDETTIELFESCNRIRAKHRSLTDFDALALVFCITKGYCLVTNDIRLQKACDDYEVNFVTSVYIKKFI